MVRMSSSSHQSVLVDFVGVMGQLQDIIQTENDFLSRGLPATLLATTVRKRSLTREYVELSSELVDRAAEAVLADPDLHHKLVAAGAHLQALSEENRTLLENALAASHRRIDAVMLAIQDSDDAKPTDDGSPLARR